MEIEDFRNTTLVVDLLTSKTICFFLMTNYSMWWSFVKIGLKLWPEGDKQTDRQTDRITKSTDQYTWKIFDFARSKKKTSCRARYLQNPPPLQRLPWIREIVHFIKIKIENLYQSSGQSDENILFLRLKLMILEVWPRVDLWPFNLKNCLYGSMHQRSAPLRPRSAGTPGASV